MIKTITQEWLKEKGACHDACEEWNNEKDHGTIATLNRLMTKNPSWANWLIVRVMTRKQFVAYAIYAAEQVIDIYEKKYPDDKRPRQAIKAAELCLKNDSTKNKNVAASAAAAAADAAYVASSASSAASAADAASSASSAARAANASSAASAADAASSASSAARAANASERKKMQTKILKHGMTLLK